MTERPTQGWTIRSLNGHAHEIFDGDGAKIATVLCDEELAKRFARLPAMEAEASEAEDLVAELRQSLIGAEVVIAALRGLRSLWQDSSAAELDEAARLAVDNTYLAEQRALRAELAVRALREAADETPDTVLSRLTVALERTIVWRHDHERLALAARGALGYIAESAIQPEAGRCAERLAQLASEVLGAPGGDAEALDPWGKTKGGAYAPDRSNARLDGHERGVIPGALAGGNGTSPPSSLAEMQAELDGYRDAALRWEAEHARAVEALDEERAHHNEAVLARDEARRGRNTETLKALEVERERDGARAEVERLRALLRRALNEATDEDNADRCTWCDTDLEMGDPHRPDTLCGDIADALDPSLSDDTADDAERRQGDDGVAYRCGDALCPCSTAAGADGRAS